MENSELRKRWRRRWNILSGRRYNRRRIRGIKNEYKYVVVIIITRMVRLKLLWN